MNRRWVWVAAAVCLGAVFDQVAAQNSSGAAPSAAASASAPRPARPARGRVYGESRVVCGVHFVSDVEAGRLATSGVVAAMSGNAEFQADLAAAREEVEALRAEAGETPAAGQCAAEQAAAARPW